MKIRFMTGEMAKLHGISKQTLIHYDRIGLFCPAEVDSDTDYRYYDLEQFQDLELILILKALGMQLQEIKAYRQQTTLTARLALLESQREIVEKKMKQLKSMEQRLESMVGNIKHNITVEPFSKGIKWLEERKLYSIPVLSPYDIYQMELSFKEMFRYIKEKSEVDVHDFLYVVKDSVDGEELFEKISIPVGEGGNEIGPAGYYAYLYHQGPYAELLNSRKQLENYIQESGYEPVGAFIEKVLLSGIEVADESKYLVEILVQVVER